MASLFCHTTSQTLFPTCLKSSGQGFILDLKDRISFIKTQGAEEEEVMRCSWHIVAGLFPVLLLSLVLLLSQTKNPNPITMTKIPERLFPHNLKCPIYIPQETKWSKEFQQRLKDGLCDRHGLWAQDISRDDHFALFRATVAALHLTTETQILDIGSGCGHTEGVIQTEYGARALAVEFVKPLAELAAERYKSEHLKFCNADASAVSSLPPQSFDFVFAVAVYIYLEGREACSAALGAFELLRPGGIFWLGWMFFFPEGPNGNRMPVSSWEKCVASWRRPDAWLEVAPEKGRTRQPKFQRTSSLFIHRRCMPHEKDVQSWKHCWFSSRRVYPQVEDFYKESGVFNATRNISDTSFFELPFFKTNVSLNTTN